MKFLLEGSGNTYKSTILKNLRASGISLYFKEEPFVDLYKKAADDEERASLKNYIFSNYEACVAESIRELEILRKEKNCIADRCIFDFYQFVRYNLPEENIWQTYLRNILESQISLILKEFDVIFYLEINEGDPEISYKDWLSKIMFFLPEIENKIVYVKGSLEERLEKVKEEISKSLN